MPLVDSDNTVSEKLAKKKKEKGADPTRPARGTAKRLVQKRAEPRPIGARFRRFWTQGKIRGFLAVQSDYVKMSVRM